MKDEIKEILKDNGELFVRYKDNSFESFDTLPINVLDYITNLQEENERLLVELNKNMIERNNYKSKIDKANEYIKNEPYNVYDEDDDIESCGKYFENEQYDNLLNILEGDKDE